MTSPKRRRTSEASESSKPEPPAVAVISDDDLLTAILLRLPLKPLLRFRLVSKRWLSLISAPYFSRCRRLQFPLPGLFIDNSFLPLKNQDHDQLNPLIYDENPLNPLHKALSLVKYLRILQSCNGLLLLSCSYWVKSRLHHFNYYILNPTTQQFIPLPKLLGAGMDDLALQGIALAFDPSKSPTYKVVCLRRVNPSPDRLYQIDVYSSETGRWRVSGEPFPASFDFVRFNYGVFWNGSVHWPRALGDSLYFNVEEECVRPMPMPVTGAKVWEGHWIGYFGESRGHLHLIDICNDTYTWFNVYEMEMDYSGWFVKYRVDLGAISTAYPFVTYSFSDRPDLRHHGMGVLAVVREMEEDDSELVLYVEGKVISYNFALQSCKGLCDFYQDPYDNMSLVQHGCCVDAFPFIEYLSRV